MAHWENMMAGEYGVDVADQVKAEALQELRDAEHYVLFVLKPGKDRSVKAMWAVPPDMLGLIMAFAVHDSADNAAQEMLRNAPELMDEVRKALGKD